MAVDQATVKRIAHLARIRLGDGEAAHLEGELNAILKWIEQLSEVDVDGVEPMTSVQPMALKRRADVITDGGYPDDVVENAPRKEENFFMVPTVVE